MIPANKSSQAAINSRRKAVERIGEKKRANQTKVNQNNISQQQEDNRFRLKWKSDVKERRKDRLTARVDEDILRKAIKHEPEMFDFSRLEDINPLHGLDLEFKEEVPIEADPNPLDILILTNKMNADGRQSNQTELAVPKKNSRETNHGINSSLLSKFNKKGSLQNSLYVSEPERQLLLASLSADDSAPRIMSRTNSIDLSQDVMHSSLEAVAGIGKQNLAEISDRLVDNVFVVGPQAADIEGLAQACSQLMSDSISVDSKQQPVPMARSNTNSSGFASVASNDKEKTQRKASASKRQSEEKIEKLAPALLYCLNPMDVEIEELCFPSKVETKAVSRAAFARRNSEKRDAGTTACSSAFVFKLTGHLTSRFVLCVAVNKVIPIEKYNTEIQTSYCVCIISRFAFFSYFSFSLQQFVELGGFDFEVPLEKQDFGFPIQTALKYLNDMATKMYRVLVPLYPIDQSTQTTQSLSLDTNDALLSPSHKRNLLESRMLPPVEFQFSIKSSAAGQPSRKVDMILRRDLQLRYFATGNMFFQSGPLSSDSPLEKKIENERIWDREESFHVLLWTLPILLRKLPLDQISLAIGCALIEMHVIVLASDISVMSSCLLAIVHLLRPLKWVGVVVVTLPESQHEYLDSPVPLIAGVQKLPPNFALAPGVVVVDCQENCVKFHPTDNVTSHKFFLPQTNKLIHSLTKSAEAIYRSPARKLVNVTRKKSLGNVTLSMDAAESHERQPLAVPVDMDPTTEKGHQLMAAVNEFSNIVASHLQVLVNTAVQSAWEAKQQKYKRREQLVSRTGSPLGRQMSSAVVNANRLLNEIPSRPSSVSSATGNRQNFAMRTMHASVATAAATMRLNAKAWTSNISSVLAANGSTAGDSVHGDSSVISSQHDSKGSDSSESLPSIQKGAELFPAKAMGETGLTFIKSLQGTQMFCNYCLVRRQLSKQLRDHIETGTNDSSGDEDNGVAISTRFDEFKPEPVSSEAFAPSPSDMPLSPKDKDMSDNLLLQGSVQSSSSSQYESSSDPLVTFFQVLLCGTAPMSLQRLQTLRMAYEHNELDHSTHTSGNGINHSSLTAHPPTKYSSVDDIEREIYWCNGRCGGAANTDTCTCLCLQLWEQRVKLFTHHLAIKEIVERNHHSSLVLNPIKLDSGEIISLKHGIPALRHTRETESQYEQRSKLVNKIREREVVDRIGASSSSPETAKLVKDTEVLMPVIEGRHSYVPPSQSKEANRIDWGSPVTKGAATHTDTYDRVERIGQGRRVGKESIWFPMPAHDKQLPQGKRMAERLYARSTASPSVKAIARHFVRMQHSRHALKLECASRTIYTFLLRLRFVRYYQQRNRCARSVQAWLRGVLLRKRLPSLREATRLYQQVRVEAAKRVQVWIRHILRRREEERVNLLTFQRLMTSKSPTQIPLASAESQRSKSITRSLWSPPLYNPQPLQNPVLFSPPNPNQNPSGLRVPSGDNHDNGLQFHSIGSNDPTNSNNAQLNVRQLELSDATASAASGYGAGIGSSQQLQSLQQPLQQVGDFIQKPTAVVVLTDNGAGSGLSTKVPASDIAQMKKNKAHSASKFSLFNKVFGTHETKDKDKDKEKVIAPKSTSAIKQVGSTKAMNRFSSNNSLPQQASNLKADGTVTTIPKLPLRLEPSSIDPKRTDSKFSVLESDENMGTDVQLQSFSDSKDSVSEKISWKNSDSFIGDEIFAFKGLSAPLEPILEVDSARASTSLSNSNTADHHAVPPQAQPQPGSSSTSRSSSIAEIESAFTRPNIGATSLSASASSSSSSAAAAAALTTKSEAARRDILPSEDAKSSKEGTKTRFELKAESSMSIGDMEEAQFSILQLFEPSFPPPLQKLFNEGGDSFTRQQKKIIADMYSLLRAGIDVIKHGRGGKAHQRFLYCDEYLLTLYWRATAEANGDPNETMHRKKRLSFWGQKQDDDRCVVVQDITSISNTFENQVTNRKSSISRPSGDIRTPLCLLVDQTAALELELFEKDWKLVFDGLDILTGYYNRSRKASQLQDDSNRQLLTTREDPQSSAVRALLSEADAATIVPKKEKKQDNRRYSALY